ncbi:MAG: hypothetical protein RL688_1680, partial [Actinomycetota bacterium]
MGGLLPLRPRVPGPRGERRGGR